MFRIPLNNNYVGKKALFLNKLSRVCIFFFLIWSAIKTPNILCYSLPSNSRSICTLKIIVIVTRINEFKKNNFFILYYLTVLVYTRTTSFKALILWNMLFESEIDENVTAKSTQIALLWQ